MHVALVPRRHQALSGAVPHTPIVVVNWRSRTSLFACSMPAATGSGERCHGPTCPSSDASDAERCGCSEANFAPHATSHSTGSGAVSLQTSAMRGYLKYRGGPGKHAECFTLDGAEHDAVTGAECIAVAGRELLSVRSVRGVTRSELVCRGRRRKANRGVFHLASEICAIDLRERLKTRSTRAQAEAQLRAADRRLRASANELDAVREDPRRCPRTLVPPSQPVEGCTLGPGSCRLWPRPRQLLCRCPPQGVRHGGAEAVTWDRLDCEGRDPTWCSWSGCAAPARAATTAQHLVLPTPARPPRGASR